MILRVRSNGYFGCAQHMFSRLTAEAVTTNHPPN
jgi:hypothetical protein